MTLIDIGDTKLNVVERGLGMPLIVLHGGPGLDHREFGDYLDPLTDEMRLILVDMRGQGASDRSTEDRWTLDQMAADVSTLASAMTLDRYLVLGHSYGAFVALQHAVAHPGDSAATIVSSGVPSSRFLGGYVDDQLASFEPLELRDQVAASWEREKDAQTQEDFASLMHDQLPFHFLEPRGAIIDDYERRSAGTVYSPDVLRHFSSAGYGGIDVEDRLGRIPQPVLVLAGRHDRVCSIAAAEATAEGIPDSELVVFEQSAHMTFAEENDKYVDAVRDFVRRRVTQ